MLMRSHSPNPDFQQKIFPPVRRPGRGGVGAFEPAGALAKEAVVATICSSFHRNSCAMVRHYFFGNGARRSLESFGMHAAFRSHRSVGNAVRQFQNMVLARASSLAAEACEGSANRNRPIRRRVDIAGRFPTKVDNGRQSPLFAIGDGRLNGKSNILAEIDCSTRMFSLRGQLEFTYNDSFKDPADIFDLVDGDLEVPGGRPYDFFDSWTIPLRIQNRRITF